MWGFDRNRSGVSSSAGLALVRERAGVLGLLKEVARLEEELRAQSGGREARTHPATEKGPDGRATGPREQKNRR